MPIQIVKREGMLPQGVYFALSISQDAEFGRQVSSDSRLNDYAGVLARLVSDVVAGNAATIAAYPETQGKPVVDWSVAMDGIVADLSLVAGRAVPSNELRTLAADILLLFSYLHIDSIVQRVLEYRYRCMQLSGYLADMRRAEGTDAATIAFDNFVGEAKVSGLFDDEEPGSRKL